MMPSSADQRSLVQDAFSRQAPEFDLIEREEPMITWVRDAVRDEALRWIAPGARMLELNAGTGLDAVFFAAKGLQVLASESAPGMLVQLRLAAAGTNVKVRALDFHDLHKLPGNSFDHVFSNFGGLNCTDRLDEVLKGIDHVLVPGGRCTLVIMPRVSPWELIEVFRGHFKFAFRRFNKGGALARLEGVEFLCHYYSTRYVRHHLPGFKLLSIMALSIAVPPPHLGAFARRHSRLVRWSQRLERTIRNWPLLRTWGDHYAITLEKRG